MKYPDVLHEVLKGGKWVVQYFMYYLIDESVLLSQNSPVLT